MMAATTACSPDELGKLKQDFKFLGAELSAAKAKIRKLEKALAARPQEVITMGNENQVMTLMMRACEMLIADATRSDSEKVDAVKLTIGRARGELIMGVQK